MATLSQMIAPVMPRKASTRHQPDHVRLEPAGVLAAVHHHFEAAEAQRDQRQADEVHAALFLVLLPGRVFHHDGDEKNRDRADRHVDEENPAPARLVGDVAAERRPQHRRDDGGDGRDAESRAALGRREGVEDDRLLIGLHPAAKEALRQTEDDELRQTAGYAAQKRAHREHADADQEIALAAQEIAEPAGDGEHDAVGDEIGGQRPCRFVRARRETAGDMRQRHIDDGGVENLHEGRERDGDRDQPGIIGRLPLGVRLLRGARASCGRLGVAHFTVTSGTTEMPSGSGRFWIEAAVDDDLHRHALHHLDEIAGGVLDRKCREFRAGAELNAVHMAAQIERGIGVDLDPRGWPGPHVGELASP